MTDITKPMNEQLLVELTQRKLTGQITRNDASATAKAVKERGARVVEWYLTTVKREAARLVAVARGYGFTAMAFPSVFPPETKRF